jgi:hypothetical protein
VNSSFVHNLSVPELSKTLLHGRNFVANSKFIDSLWCASKNRQDVVMKRQKDSHVVLMRFSCDQIQNGGLVVYWVGAVRSLGLAMAVAPTNQPALPARHARVGRKGVAKFRCYWWVAKPRCAGSS